MTHLLDPTRASARIEIGLARIEQAHRRASMDAAEQWHFTAQVLAEARTSPDLYVDPALQMRPAERTDFAVRAAVADIAIRLGISENSVRDHAHLADTLRTRMPRTWAAFCDGDVVVPNARTAADLVNSLPDDASDAFDLAVADTLHLAPARFRTKARVLRERIHSIPLTERVATARETRGVWIENDVDGMAELALRMPAEEAHAAYARIDRIARHLASLPDATRTLAQLRADVAAELLQSDGTGSGVKVELGVQVPVMTILGLSDEPGILEGFGPIDADTARRLAGHAPSFTRLLTDPITADLIGVDRGTYRPPADLKRWMEVEDVTCTFIGCGRLARNSDLDHTVDAQYGGPTRAGNLAHLCRHHHRLKHLTRFAVQQNPEPGAPKLTWTTPTGHERAADPPPF